MGANFVFSSMFHVLVVVNSSCFFVIFLRDPWTDGTARGLLEFVSVHVRVRVQKSVTPSVGPVSFSLPLLNPEVGVALVS